MVYTKFLLAAVLFTGNVLSNPSFSTGPIPKSSNNFAPPSSESKKALGKPQPRYVPNGYIVQLQSDGPLAKRALDLHEDFHLMAKRLDGIDYSIRETFLEDKIFVGLSLTLKAGDVQALKSLKNVANVWPIKTIPAPAAVVRRAPLTRRYEKAVVTGTNYSLPHITGDLDVNRPHEMTGVNKAHGAGIRGRGVKIAILDTGVDYRHPSLGGCFGSGCRISFGHDFVGDSYDPEMGIPAVESADPLVTCINGGHGTHVSGIIGMVDQPGTGYGLLGVAPEATLGMYRIFGCGGGSDDDIVMKALLRAATDGANVISMSFGHILADEASNPYQPISKSLYEQGIALFASAGNAGSFGIFGPSSPAISTDIFAVGSVDNNKYPVTYALKDSDGRSLRYSANFPQDSPPGGLIVQVMSYGKPDYLLTGSFIDLYEEAAQNLTAAGIDPANVILAAKYGDFAPEVKAELAAGFGYKYFLSYATEDVESFFGKEYYVASPERAWPIDPITLVVQDSTTLLEGYGKHPLKYKIFLSSSDYFAKSTVSMTGGFMSNYSSFGPTIQYNIKPQLSAPGGNILATWPLANDGYTIISGTSMSTPFMAGSYALIKSQRPELSVGGIYALMQNSGKTLPWFYNQNIKSAAIHQGAGLLDVHNALTWESYITPTQLNVGLQKDYVNWNNVVTLNLTITNLSTRSKTYTFSHTPAGLMENKWWDLETYNRMYAYYASVKFHEESVLVKGGEKGVVSVDIIAPVPDQATWGDDAINLLDPVFSGFIVVNNNFETFNIPYAGQIWDSCRFGCSVG
ncbi:hypothetical protein HYFRA_00003013 [Hymenoscyphus fraxineus]|uniref:Peptidase S8/S53 domain-containing protein n=1 Tax=Hymenoscyphus fraxineus TaxID=746836 RepID=A0A9N9PQT3_9HELO|nr:hypothetical protein HYFRA_00003013 [Hymenoscyphus fraxineus]